MLSPSSVASAIVALFCVRDALSLQLIDVSNSSEVCGTWCAGNSRPWSMKCEWSTCKSCASCTSSPACAYPGEKKFDGEELAAEALAKDFAQKQKSALPHRAGHAMNLACLAGNFEVNPQLPDAFKKGICASPKTYPILGRITEFTPFTPETLSFSTKIFDEIESQTQDFIGNAFQLFNFGMGEWGAPEEMSPYIIPGPGFGNVIEAAKTLTEFELAEPDVPMEPHVTTDMSGMLQTDADVTTANTRKSNSSNAPMGYRFDVAGGHPINWADEGPPRGLRFWLDAPFLKSSCFSEKEAKDWGTCLSSNAVEEAVRQTMTDNEGELVVSLWGQLQGCDDEIEEDRSVWKSAEIAELGKLKFSSLISPAVCETASMTPWNHHPAHKPMSSLGRVRKLVYGHNQQMRRDANAELMTKEIFFGALDI